MASVVTETGAAAASDAGAGDVAASTEELLARVLDDATVARLTEQARDNGLALVGPGGLLQS